jgi:hypothetical protein
MSRDDIWIQSTRDPGHEGMCEITWGPIQFYAPVGDVRATALDLVSCAAASEMLMQLIALGLPKEHVSGFMSDVLKRDKPFGAPTTLELWPGGSSKRSEPVVLVRRAGTGEPDLSEPWQDTISPDTAREMARAWFEVAEATDSDMKLAEALRLIRQHKIEDALFATLRKLRRTP